MTNDIYRAALHDIINAREHHRDHFADDADFAGWVVTRAMKALASRQEQPASEDKPSDFAIAEAYRCGYEQGVAALTEPLERRIKELEDLVAACQFGIGITRRDDRIIELEAEIAHWHNVVIKEVAAQSIVPKVPLTDEECHAILESMATHVNDLADRSEVEPSPERHSAMAVKYILDAVAAHGIGGKV